MKKLLFICILFSVFCLQAQEIKINKGDFEVAASGEFNQAVLGGQIRFGSFVADYIQLGVDLVYYDTERVNRFSLGTFMSYTFETQTYLLPYVGGKLALSSLDPEEGEGESGLDFTLLFGLKYFVADNVSLNTELHLGYAAADTYIDGDEATDTDYGVTIGLSYYW